MNPAELFDFARAYLPGGVCSSTRLNRAIERPFYVSRADGAKVYDLGGREYIDLCTSHGASLLGHNHPKVREAVVQALGLGIMCSYENEQQSRLAKKVCDMVPCADMVRFTASGTEATLHCLRLARAFTGRDKIIRFEGHFHGYHDYVYIGGHPPLDASGALAHPSPCVECEGIPERMRDLVISIPFNDVGVLEDAIRRHRDDVACVILEPVNYNSGCVKPRPGYLEAVRELTRDCGALLLFDEVMSAFRMCPGGAQECFGVVPDLCTIGKALGAGVPLSAFCGRRDIMEHVRPVGNCEHSGTFNATMIQVMAGNAALDEYAAPGFYEHIEQLGQQFDRGFKDIFSRARLKARTQRVGARFGIYFGIDEEVTDYRQAAKHDRAMMLRFVRECIARGVYFHDYGGSACHHGYSAAHTSADVANCMDRIDEAVGTLR